MRVGVTAFLQGISSLSKRWDHDGLWNSPEDYFQYIAVLESVRCRPRLHLTTRG